MKLQTNYSSGLNTYGDSFTNSQGASVTANGYGPQLAALVGGTYTNNGVSGEGMYTAAKRAIGSATRRRNVVSVLAGLNDARRAGLAAQDKIIANLRAFIIVNLLASSSPASALSRTGTWNALGSSLPSRSNTALGGTGLYTSDINATMAYNFKGDSVVVGTFTTGSGSVYQDMDCSIDGGPRATFTNANLTNEAYGHNAILIKGLGAGSHTLRIYPKSATPYTVVDYVGTPLAEPMAAGPILVGQIPYVVNWLYAGFTLTPAMVDTINDAIETLVNEFSEYPVRLVRTNDFYDTSTGCSSDCIHPNDTGYAQILSAFLDQIDISS